MKRRKGFTLIEVVVAMGIFFIVLIAFLGSYYSYYRNVQYTRYKTIGENLAQLQLEDIQNLAVSVLTNLVGETNMSGPGLGSNLPNYPTDINSSPVVYDSDIMSSEFTIEGLISFPDNPLLLPSSISLDEGNGILKLEKWEYPRYEKEIIITDETPDLSEEKKIFNIKVIVYWNQQTKSITVTGEKSYARSSPPPT